MEKEAFTEPPNLTHQPTYAPELLKIGKITSDVRTALTDADLEVTLHGRIIASLMGLLCGVTWNERFYFHDRDVYIRFPNHDLVDDLNHHFIHVAILFTHWCTLAMPSFIQTPVHPSQPHPTHDLAWFRRGIAGSRQTLHDRIVGLVFNYAAKDPITLEVQTPDGSKVSFRIPSRSDILSGMSERDVADDSVIGSSQIVSTERCQLITTVRGNNIVAPLVDGSPPLRSGEAFSYRREHLTSARPFAIASEGKTS